MSLETIILMVLVVPLAMPIGIGSIVTLKLNGWDALADQFPARQKFGGPWIGFQALSFGGLIRMGNCVGVGMSEEFLHLKLFRLVFPFAKEIQIPHSDVC
ncbi:MAG: hypothetical protein U0105_03625 [Candidatus Obscuribacterales bacterium]